MTEVVLVAAIAAGSTLVGTALGVWGTFAVTNRTARLEERKHFRELGLQIAITKFEGCSKLAQQLADATGKFQEIPPFEAFVIESTKFMDIVATPGLSAHETARRLALLRDFTKTIREAAKQK